MSWRTVVVSRSAKLDYQMGYMVVRQEETIRIFLNEINTVIIETTAVSITGTLMCELVKNKIKVIFCDEKRNPSSELMPYYGSHDTSAKIRNQITWSSDIKAVVWTEIVTEKIKKQMELLNKINKNQEAALLQSYIDDIQYGDSSNREGHAAKVYFNAMFGKDFTRTSDCNVNAALNYGYSIILSSFTREIVANGYITQIGLFHDNMFNQFNLASDLMEPFRPIVDELVFNMELHDFEKSEKMEIVNLLNKQVYINNRTEYINNAIKIYCKSVFDALGDKDIAMIKFYSL
jgi:CRISPR-associated protein Cas1